MNSLSWIIYFAEVSGEVKGMLRTITVVGFLAYAVFLIHGNFRWFVYDIENDGILIRFGETWRKALLLFVPAFLAAIFPSQDTVYAIAVSELGEEVLSTETGGKAVEALNAWLDRQIDGPAPAGQDQSGDPQ